MYVGTSDHGADVRVGGQLSRVSFLHHMVRNSVFRLDSKPFYPGNCLIGPCVQIALAGGSIRDSLTGRQQYLPKLWLIV